MSKLFEWLKTTKTKWWVDSAVPVEIEEGIRRGSLGVTTNPYLLRKSLYEHKESWQSILKNIPLSLKDDEKVQSIMKEIITGIAQTLFPIYKDSNGELGYVCAQVSPKMQSNYEDMLVMAERFHSWAPNIAVKLPATSAALDVMAKCAGLGITTVITVGFSVAQSVAAAEKYRQALSEMKKKTPGKKPGRCFSVIMVGRLDDYLRDVARDSNASVPESDIVQAGIAVTKKTYQIYQENNYEAILLVSGFRSEKQPMSLLGADMLLSLSPDICRKLEQQENKYSESIDSPIDQDVIRRLSTMKEFNKAYETEGLLKEDFIGYGPVQRTLTQFDDAGWSRIADFELGSR